MKDWINEGRGELGERERERERRVQMKEDMVCIDDQKIRVIFLSQIANSCLFLKEGESSSFHKDSM